MGTWSTIWRIASQSVCLSPSAVKRQVSHLTHRVLNSLELGNPVQVLSLWEYQLHPSCFIVLSQIILHQSPPIKGLIKNGKQFFVDSTNNFKVPIFILLKTHFLIWKLLMVRISEGLLQGQPWYQTPLVIRLKFYLSLMV